jgi:hypothetical protein
MVTRKNRCILNSGKAACRVLAFACLLFGNGCLPKAAAQSSNALEVETTTHFGVVWRHSKKLTTHTGELLNAQEIGFRIQTRGRRDWHQWQNFPALGIRLCHFRLGDGDHGDAYGMLPNLLVPLVRSHWFAANFGVGTGLAWVTRPYDSFTNTGQNAIGSHWNNLTQFRLGAEFRCSPHWRIQTGMALNHLSNGGSALPNYGINLPTGYFGLNWAPGGVDESQFVRSGASRRVARHLGGQLQAGLALIEYSVPDGPRYPVWQYSAAATWQFSKINRMSAGIDYEFNKAVWEWGLHINQFTSNADADRGAKRLAFTLGDEFLFGNLGIQVLHGWYLGDYYNQFVLRRAYNKLSIRYYFPAIPHTGIRLHAGVTLKAHAITAEYISWNVGLLF